MSPRICPGNYEIRIFTLNIDLISFLFQGLNLADTTVFFTCAMVLATFDISKAVENGVVIEPSGEYTAGTVR